MFSIEVTQGPYFSIRMGEVDSELWIKYMTQPQPLMLLKPCIELHQQEQILQLQLQLKRSCELFSCTQTHSCLRYSGQHAIHCTLAQTNPMHNFRATKFQTRHANNQPMTQLLHFRRPQNSNNQRRRLRFKNRPGLMSRQNTY